MKIKCIFLFVLLFVGFVSFSYIPVYANPAPTPKLSEGFVDKSCECYAYALDQARGVQTNDAYKTKCEASDENINGEAYRQNSLADIFGATAGMLIGACQTTNISDNNGGAYLNKSAVGFVSYSINTLITHPPASSIDYIAYTLEHAGLIHPVYAQGVGYSGLKPVLSLWRAMRNLSYIIIVIVLIVIGFMIMFRAQINPQTVINIQNALPNIVVTLILITFSYAIVGLLIDLMYFLIMFSVAFIGSQSGSNTSSLHDLQSQYVGSNAGTLFKEFMIGGNWTTLPGAIIAHAGKLNSNPFDKNLTLNILRGILGAGETIGALIVWVLVGLGLLFSFVKVFVILLNSYIQIILGVIISPLQLLVGAIPGRSTFKNWLFGMIGNIIMFPTLVTILLIADFIGKQVRDSGSGNLWSPPFLLGQTADADVMLALFQFGLVMLIPSLLLTVKKLFAAQPIIPISVGTVMSPLMGIAQSGEQVLTYKYGIKEIGNFIAKLRGKKKEGED